MPHRTSKLGDGFPRQSPELRDDVRRLQLALEKFGYSVVADGLFGRNTEAAVKAFQRDRGLEVNGIVGPNTWRSLEGEVEAEEVSASTPTLSDAASVLVGFRGDALWVHAREGHAGRAYSPGGQSGVTLDPGIDLGHAEAALVEQLYTPIISAQQLAAVQSVYGIIGEAAKAALDGNTTLQSIRISRAQLDEIFPYTAEPYWNAIVKRFPTLANADTPGSVQAALLSLAYNRGPGNRGLSVLGQPLEDKNWAEVANLIGNMQQDHQLEGIRRRRHMEADLIRQELGAA